MTNVASSLLAGIALLAIPASAHTPDADILGAPIERPVISYGDMAPSRRDAEIIDWAIDRYVVAGLQLPDLEISMSYICDGKAALYHVGERRVEFCRVNRLTALHEFAHAWDDSSGVPDRDRFLADRGLTVWFGGLDVPAEQQGSEQLAMIVAWALIDPEFRRPPNMPGSSDEELERAYELLTGDSLPEP